AVSDLKTFKPAATALPLGTPFSVSTLNFCTHPWTVSDQRGGYVFFIAAVKAGALADGSATSDEILGLATASFTLR
ncbi:MAG TPA: hypothetical protein VLI89_00655, partial [Burkholderiales bacterium]|nr:hypothetical protein [Burkholderiales bacterium]